MQKVKVMIRQLLTSEPESVRWASGFGAIRRRAAVQRSRAGTDRVRPVGPPSALCSDPPRGAAAEGGPTVAELRPPRVLGTAGVMASCLDREQTLSEFSSKPEPGDGGEVWARSRVRRSAEPPTSCRADGAGQASPRTRVCGGYEESGCF